LKKNISLLLLIYLLVGCSTDTSEWYDSKEDAIKYGLIQEGSNAILLSVEEYADETIVFIELNNALGVASITESKKGYSWYRGEPYSGFGGDAPYSRMGFDIGTKEGTEVSILVGEAFDTNIQKVKLLGDGNERELPITEKSRLYDAIHDSPYGSLKIVPIVED
jgi:hypothetical protein